MACSYKYNYVQRRPDSTLIEEQLNQPNQWSCTTIITPFLAQCRQFGS